MGGFQHRGVLPQTESPMVKFFESAIHVTLNSLEMIAIAICAGAILWFFGLVGVAPYFEYWTAVYIILFFFVMFSVAGDMIRRGVEEVLTAR